MQPSIAPRPAAAAFATHAATDKPVSTDMLSALPTAVYTCDADGLITFYNEAAAELWGERPTLRDPQQLFCGSFRLHLPSGVPLPHAECPMALAVRHGTVTRDAEVVVEHRDGTRRIALVNIRPLRGDGGEVIGAINSLIDITERKRLQAELEQRRQDLEDFFENGAVALHLVGSDGNIIRANQAELELLGYSAEEYIGQPISRFHADAWTIDDILKRLRRGEKIDKYPARLRAKDGSIKHVQITSTGRFRRGELLYTRCFTIDVTSQHVAEVALRERERWFRDLLEALPAAVYTTDAAGRITFFNKAAIELSGRTPELGSDTWCVTWRLLWPDGRPLPHDECPMAIALRENRPVRGMEAVAERPDGTRVPFIPYPTPLHDASGALIGAVNVLVDISQRKESETRIRLLLDELNHRVKNSLATVQALAAQSFRKEESREAYATFTGRLMAMAQVHDLLADHKSGAASALAIAESVLEPYRDSTQSRISFNGEHVPVPTRMAMPLAIILHEMATNAAKYGSLTQPAGSVAISLSSSVQAGERSLHLLWEESGGPKVAPPNREGFGLRLIQTMARKQLGGTVELGFAAGGLVARFDLPLTDTE